MRRSAWLLALVVLTAACSNNAATEPPSTTTTAPPATTSTATATPEDTAFPVTVAVGGAEVTLEERPTRIVSLSPTATETLFAIGAGDQVVAVDEFSNYPDDAPTTELSGFTPNIEAIAEFDPDLIVIAFDPDSMISDAFAPLGVPVVNQAPAVDRDDLLAQIEQLGALTGQTPQAVFLTSEIAERWDAAVAADAGGAKVYIELDQNLFSASSNSFMGAPLVEMGFVNIADAADEEGFGFPQMSAEAIIEANPDVILVNNDATTDDGDSIRTRPGWEVIAAVANDRVVVVDSDLSSRWGPRFVHYIEEMAALAESLVPVEG